MATATKTPTSTALLLLVLLLICWSPRLSCNTDVVLVPNQDSDGDGEATVEVDAAAAAAADPQDVFQPTEEWQEVKPGQVVPAGLHIRINLQTGKKEARLLKEEGDDDDREEKTKEMRGKAREEESIGKIDDGGKSSSSSSGLRSYQELRRLKELEDVAFNTEFEVVRTLADAYSNATVADRLVLLDDLEFYLHQYDNARDFVTIGGMENILEDAFSAGVGTNADASPADAAEMRDRAAMVFSACVQSHPDVKEKVLARGWITTLLRRLKDEGSAVVRRRLVYALGCLVRGHEGSRRQLNTERGYETVLKVLGEGDEKTRIKVLVFLADVVGEDPGAMDDVLGYSDGRDELCGPMAQVVGKLQANEYDRLEKMSQVLEVFAGTCGPHLADQRGHLSHLLSAVEAMGEVEDEEAGLGEVAPALRSAVVAAVAAAAAENKKAPVASFKGEL